MNYGQDCTFFVMTFHQYPNDIPPTIVNNSFQLQIYITACVLGTKEEQTEIKSDDNVLIVGNFGVYKIQVESNSVPPPDNTHSNNNKTNMDRDPATSSHLAKAIAGNNIGSLMEYQLFVFVATT